MKKYLLLSACALSALLFAGGCINGLTYEGGSGAIKKYDVKAAPFQRLIVVGSFDVYLRQDSVQSIILETDQNLFSKVRFESHDETLRIATKKRLFPTKMVLYISSPNLSEISVDGRADIQGKGAISYKYIDVTIHGAGDVKFENLTVERLRAKIDGFGNFIVNGSARKSIFEIDGFGDIRADNFHSNFCDAEVNGIGDIFVWADSTLNAKIHGSGDISYYGGARIVSAAIDGPGKVKNRNK